MQPKNNIRFTVFGDLIKYRLSLAVVFSSGTGFFLFRNSFDYSLLLLLLGVFLLASGSIALNQYTERERDSLMERTRERPIPSKKLTRMSAEKLFTFLLIAGICVLLATGLIPFFLGIINVILYNLVYTPLKKKTSLAILPGALVGAIPPLIGFTAAGGSLLDHRILFLAIFMFLWQIPHFWLLLIRYGNDYRKAGFVTISDYLNESQIRNIIFLWILLTSLFLLISTGFTRIFSRGFFYIMLALNPVFIFFFYRELFSHDKSNNQRYAFIILNGFGILILFLLIADSFLKAI